MTTSEQDGDEFSVPPAADDPQQLYDRAPCGYLSTTPNGVIVRVNQTFLTWTGYTPADLVGQRSLSSLLSGGGRIYHDTHYAPMLLMQDYVREIALEIVTADGSRIPVLLNATLDRNESGEPTLIRIVMLDATERRRYEAELLHAKRRAEELANTLQKTLLPPVLPEIPGLEVAAAYRPAGTGGHVGGDFYDIFQIAENDWWVVLGDVCGKGVEAAVVTSLARHTIRAVTVRMHEPDEALAVLDEVIRRHDTERFCTVVLIRLRRAEDTWNLTFSLGGHLPPLVLEPGSPPRQVGTLGSLVGLLPDPRFHATELTLKPGSYLLLYTDGLTEAGHGTYGEARLAESADRHTGSAHSLVEGVVDDVLAFEDGPLRDDVAVVGIRVLD